MWSSGGALLELRGAGGLDVLEPGEIRPPRITNGSIAPAAATADALRHSAFATSSNDSRNAPALAVAARPPHGSSDTDTYRDPDRISVGKT